MYLSNKACKSWMTPGRFRPWCIFIGATIIISMICFKWKAEIGPSSPSYWRDNNFRTVSSEPWQLSTLMEDEEDDKDSSVLEERLKWLPNIPGDCPEDVEKEAGFTKIEDYMNVEQSEGSQDYIDQYFHEDDLDYDLDDEIDNEDDLEDDREDNLKDDD